MILVWLDLETTGLDPRDCSILEMAIGIATLGEPFKIGPVHNWVFHYDDPRPRQSLLHPVVIDMHAKNGLWDECAKSELVLYDVVEQLEALIPRVKDMEHKPTLAGNCVGFDHSFLNRHLPTIGSLFHYRHYDVSAVKLFCRSLGMPRLPKQDAHRALPDIEASIYDAKRCATWLDSFKAEARHIL